jgi:hypothetical protein
MMRFLVDRWMDGFTCCLYLCSDAGLDEKHLAGRRGGMLGFKLSLHGYRGKGGASVRIDWAGGIPAL